MWTILNSPIFLLLLGFLFTTVAGTIITARYQRATYKQETRFARLHEERASAIRDLYAHIVDVEWALNSLLYKWRPVGLFPPNIEPADVSTRIRELRRLSEKAAIYFNKELYKLIESLCDTLDGTWRNMEQAIMRISDPEHEVPDFDDEAWRGVHVTSREVRERLQAEFRSILGAE